MRILVANDGLADAGGVQSYLDAILPGLASRGHAIAVLHAQSDLSEPANGPARPFQTFTVAGGGTEAALASVATWAPDICFSHNMSRLDVERRLVALAPTVKFMHGYFGTCISGQKRFGWPRPVPCDRVFGAACIAAYFPRHCGQFSVTKLSRQYRWALEQRALFASYAAVVVASAHMRREYSRHGIDPGRLHVNPLFSTIDGLSGGERDETTNAESSPLSVAFLGRMTTLKGGDLLIRAVAEAASRIRRSIHLTFVGDGPQRAPWEELARRLGVSCAFVGWQYGEHRWDWLRHVHLLAVPSTWPEPFGLVGLEAAALGIPAIAFDVGGIREWLRPGENGYLVDGNPPSASSLADGLVTAFARPSDLAAMRRGARAAARDMSLAAHLDRLEHVLTLAAKMHANSPAR